MAQHGFAPLFRSKTLKGLEVTQTWSVSVLGTTGLAQCCCSRVVLFLAAILY